MYSTKKSRKQRFHSFFLLLLHCLVVLSCAQVTAPTGGKKDTTPPTVAKSSPENYSINFTKKEIKIVFNEWILPLQNPKNQIIISPEILPFPKVEAARNELSIKWKDILQPNTTYSIFFGDNIKDNNEGNILPNFKFLFSTGSFIDSLQVKGRVQTMLSKFPDNTYLLLYKEKEDSVFTKKRPFYITKIKNDGSFILENVKEGDYRIFALSDQNSNYYYDLPSEAIGFTDSFYHIASNLDTLSFQLFMPEVADLRITEYDRVIKGGIFHITFNKELSFNKDEITISLPDLKDVQPIAFQEKENGKLTVYLPKLDKDTGIIQLIIKNNNQLIDSLRVKTESKKYKNPVPFFNDTTAYKTLSVIETTPLKLVSTYRSLTDIDTAKIVLTDTAHTSIPFLVSRAEDMQTYQISAAWKPGMKYTLKVSDSALTDLVGNSSKSHEFSFSAVSVKKAGNLLINYELPKKESSYILFLKDNSDKVLDKRILRDSQAVKIDYGLLFAGTYKVEVIEDLNDNGIWNSGSFTTKSLPEKIYKEIKPIIIKENWDAEETIKVDFTKISVPAQNPAEGLEQKNSNSPNLQKPRQLNNSQDQGKD